MTFAEEILNGKLHFLCSGRHYNFFNAREVVSNFLTVFDNMFVPRPNLRQVSFKSTFTIVNCQPARKVGLAEITASRVWQTNLYDGMYFNDYVKTNLDGGILKRVIMTDMTGSSWRFKRFDRLCITVYSDQYRGVGNWITNFEDGIY